MAVSYSEATDLIQDGDIVFVHGSPYNAIQALIMFFTGSAFSHCCIAFHVDIGGFDRVMVVEAQGNTRRRIVPLGMYDGNDLTIVAAPKKWDEVKKVALSNVGVAKYNMLRAIYTGICEYSARRFNVRLPQMERQDEICSDFIGDVYGFTVNGSPQVCYNKLMKVSHER